VEVVLRYFDGCPNWQTARERLRAALDSHGQAGTVIDLQRVETDAEAVRLRFAGSPTILLDGLDPFGDTGGPYGLACRVYSTPEGLAGAPTEDQFSALVSARLPGTA
jgi:hypothetical protein